MHDVIVGARSAGASTAMLLARKGHRVLLVDRARFPSDTPTGHYIHQPGTAVTGITGRTEAGRRVHESARIVVRADGVHSRLARAVGAASYHGRPAMTAAWWSYWSGVPASGPELHLGPRRLNGAFPTNDGRTCVFVTVPSDEIAAFRGDIEAGFDRSLDLTPRLAVRVREGRREERWYGNTETHGFFRRRYGPGWALVGDAGYHKDPITGQGISDAFRDAELLAEAIAA